MYFYAYYGIHQTFSLVYMIRDFMILSNINVTGPWGRRQARITKGWHRGRKVGAEEVKDHTRITISSGYYTSKYVCKWYVFYFRSSLTLCIFKLLLTKWCSVHSVQQKMVFWLLFKRHIFCRLHSFRQIPNVSEKTFAGNRITQYRTEDAVLKHVCSGKCEMK